MTPQEIRNQADQLSRFDGAMLAAVGEGDDLLHFRGNGTNLATQGLDQFTMIITNANAASRTARIFCPIATDYATQYPGLVATGAFNDTGGNAGLSGASGTSFSIETWLYYVQKNPSRLMHLREQSTVNGQLVNALTLDEINPYRDITNTLIYPQNEIGQDTFNQNIVIFKVNAQLDYLKDLQLTFVGSSTTYLTFYMGAEFNSAKALEKKYSRAQGAMMAGGDSLKNALNANAARKQLGV